MHKPILFLSALVALLTVLGCMTRQIYDLRADQATSAATFDSGCPTMRLVERIGNERFKMHGCGKTIIYLCENQHSPEYNQTQTMLRLSVIGESSIESKCSPVSTVYDAPSQQAQPSTKADETALSRKQVVDGMAPVLKNAKESCVIGNNAGGMVELSILISKEGDVHDVSASEKSTASPESVRCVSGLARMAKFPPFEGKSLRIAYPIRLGPAQAEAQDQPPEPQQSQGMLEDKQDDQSKAISDQPY